MTAFVLDKPEQINMFHVMQHRSALRLELNTGMTFSDRGNIALSAILNGYTSYDRGNPPTRMTGKVKRKVYADLNELIVSGGGQDRPLKASE